MNKPNTVNKVEVQCVCGRKHIVKLNARKEVPCKCGSGVCAVYDGKFLTPWLYHAPDRFDGSKPVITKQFWNNGLRVNVPRGYKS